MQMHARPVAPQKRRKPDGGPAGWPATPARRCCFQRKVWQARRGARAGAAPAGPGAAPPGAGRPRTAAQVAVHDARRVQRGHAARDVGHDGGHHPRICGAQRRRAQPALARCVLRRPTPYESAIHGPRCQPGCFRAGVGPAGNVHCQPQRVAPRALIASHEYTCSTAGQSCMRTAEHPHFAWTHHGSKDMEDQCRQPPPGRPWLCRHCHTPGNKGQVAAHVRRSTPAPGNFQVAPDKQPHLQRPCSSRAASPGSSGTPLRAQAGQGSGRPGARRQAAAVAEVKQQPHLALLALCRPAAAAAAAGPGAAAGKQLRRRPAPVAPPRGPRHARRAARARRAGRRSAGARRPEPRQAAPGARGVPVTRTARGRGAVAAPAGPLLAAQAALAAACAAAAAAMACAGGRCALARGVAELRAVHRAAAGTGARAAGARAGGILEPRAEP